jgi:uncharacterized protein YndB with AHSA1/START domain
MSEQDVAGKSTMTLVGVRELHVERVFDAPRERVFAAYTDPELIPKWWGPRNATTIVEEMDATTGGDWRFRARGEDGNEIVFRGVYREVVAPERIVQTFEWDGMPGYVSVDSVSFEELGDRTRVISDSIFFTAEERDGMLESGMEGGMNETYDRLDELLAEQAG